MKIGRVGAIRKMNEELTNSDGVFVCGKRGGHERILMVGLLVIVAVAVGTLLWLYQSEGEVLERCNEHYLEQLEVACSVEERIDGFIGFEEYHSEDLEEGEEINCCYPSGCEEAKNNPDSCSCTYAVMCGTLEELGIGGGTG